MRSLVVGMGEIGKALYNVLRPFYEIDPLDIGDEIRADKKFEIIHICFPYDQGFLDEVKRYQEIFVPAYTVIHSTVPVGTSASLGAAHSPVRGSHPYLEQSLKSFVKFVGGPGADEIARYFMRAGLRVHVCRRSETTELGKLLCTTFYGVAIEYTKEAERLCRGLDVPFAEAWILFQESYNQGYEKLGRPEYRRPILQPLEGTIGGHCVLENCELLDSVFAEIVKAMGRIK